jgi:quinol monooxygenase YgiN
MIHVLATIETAPGQRDHVLAEFRRIIPTVRAENGCLEYGTAIDVAADSPAQPPLRPHTIVVVEKWSDLAALKAHSQAPHMQEFRQRTEGAITSLSLQVLTPVD